MFTITYTDGLNTLITTVKAEDRSEAIYLFYVRNPHADIISIREEES